MGIFEAVSSTLNLHWSQEYICKQTPEYKELFFLKTITQYLKMDTVALKKVEALYKHLMSKQINVDIIEQDSSKNKKIINLNQFKKNKLPNNIFKSQIVNYLESIFFEKHLLMFGDILKKKYPFTLADFFNDDEIMQLIEGVNRPSL